MGNPTERRFRSAFPRLFVRQHFNTNLRHRSKTDPVDTLFNAAHAARDRSIHS